MPGGRDSINIQGTEKGEGRRDILALRLLHFVRDILPFCVVISTESATSLCARQSTFTLAPSLGPKVASVSGGFHFPHVLTPLQG